METGWQNGRPLELTTLLQKTQEAEEWGCGAQNSGLGELYRTNGLVSAKINSKKEKERKTYRLKEI